MVDFYNGLIGPADDRTIVVLLIPALANRKPTIFITIVRSPELTAMMTVPGDRILYHSLLYKRVDYGTSD